MSVSSDLTGLTDEDLKSVSINKYEREFEDEEEKGFYFLYLTKKKNFSTKKLTPNQQDHKKAQKMKNSSKHC
jgi:hypothetical protein